MNNTQIVESLKAGKVEFSYYKGDGTLRKAYGTLSVDCIPYCQAVENTTKKDVAVFATSQSTEKDVDPTITYFDLDVEQWRAFRLSRLVSE